MMNLKLMVVSTLVVVAGFAATLWLYGSFYALHQDVAGSALNAALAVALGAEFESYAAYFPPMEWIWFATAVRLAALTGLSTDMAVVLMTLFAVTFSAGFAFYLRLRTKGADLLFFALPFLFLLIVPILYKNTFGLREHFVLLGLWPYLVLRAAGDDARRIGLGPRVILGIWMGCTLLFKYFYSIVVFAVEVADAIVRRKFWLLFRIENVIAGMIVATYLAVWLIFDSEQVAAIKSIRGAISANIASAEASLRIAINLFAIGVAAWLLLFRFRVAPDVRLLGFAAILGAIAVAWLQGRWYTHHLFPVFVGFVAWWWLVGSGFPKWLHAALAIALAFPLVEQFQNTAIYKARVDALHDVMDDQGLSFTGQRVGLLNQHPSPFNQVILAQEGLRWSMPMNMPYVSAALKPFDTPAMQGQEPPPVDFETPGMALMHGQLMQLWQDYPPDVLVLDTSRQWPLRYIDYRWEAVFADDRAFQQVLDGYDRVYSHDDALLQFVYFVRKEN